MNAPSLLGKDRPSSPRGKREPAGESTRRFILSHRLLGLAVVFSLMIAMGGWWVRRSFGPCSVEQALFHAMMSKTGMDHNFLVSFAVCVLVLPWALAVPVLAALNRLMRRSGGAGRCAVAVLWMGAAAYGGSAFYGYGYLASWLGPHTEDFYGTNYVRVPPDSITFEKPRNLIVLYMESFEATYGSPEVFPENLMPRLTAARERHQSVPDAFQAYGTNWTMAGLVASQCGLPLRIPIDYNGMGAYGAFLPGAVCLTDVLERNGYAVRFMQGSDAGFAGKDKFFATHGLPAEDFLDYGRLVARTPEAAEKPGTEWGLRDSELYRELREELTALAARNQPFAVLALTVDTHHPEGYLDPGCASEYGDFRDVLLCADAMAGDFLDWAAAQPFAADTVVVVVSDHLAMLNPVYASLESHQDRRRNLNIIINPARPLPDTGRAITHFDLYPTILEAMGATLPGGRIGLGVSLYAETPTLVELMNGPDELERNLWTYSDFYDELLLRPGREDS